MRAAVTVVFTLTLAALGACTARDSSVIPPVLLFTGTGVSPNDVAAIQTILDGSRIGYATTTSDQLNAMDAARLRTYRLIVMPGGNFIDMGDALTPAATAKVRDAVHDGVNYLGICAGGFLAGHFTGHNSFDLTSGVRFGFYAIEAQGLRKAAVPIARPGHQTLEHYWEDGPQFTGWGEPVATYPDGTPAVVEGAFGRGWVVLSGVHPEAPESWRKGMTFGTPAIVDNAFAAMLVRAALERTSLLPR